MESRREKFENHPVGVWVLAFGAVSSLLLNAVALRDVLVPHNYYGAQELANEYFENVVELKDYDDALKKFNNIYSLSIDYSGYDKSSSCYMGIRPDELVLARSVVVRNRWVIGLDRRSGQSDLVVVDADIKTLEERFNLIGSNLKCLENLSDEALSGFNYLHKRFSGGLVKPDYYSSSSYASMYGVSLINSKKYGL